MLWRDKYYVWTCRASISRYVTPLTRYGCLRVDHGQLDSDAQWLGLGTHCILDLIFVLCIHSAVTDIEARTTIPYKLGELPGQTLRLHVNWFRDCLSTLCQSMYDRHTLLLFNETPLFWLPWYGYNWNVRGLGIASLLTHNEITSLLLPMWTLVLICHPLTYSVSITCP